MATGGDDPNLFERARAGDEAALGELLERSRARLQRIAARRMGERLRERVRVSDVVQSAFVEALRGLDGFRGDSEAEFLRWLEAILENRVRKRGRWFGADKRRSDEACPVEPPQPVTPSRVLEGREEQERVWAALGELPDAHREVLLLRLDGTGASELAEAIGTTPVNARSLLRRARATLRARLE